MSLCGLSLGISMIYLLAISIIGNFLLTLYRMGVSLSDRLLPMSLDRVHAFARMPFLSQLPLVALPCPANQWHY
jgi:hypothetical protein